MLRTICEARSNSATRAALAVWIYKDKGTKMTDKLLDELQLRGEAAREHLYKLREPPRIIHRRKSTKDDFLIDLVLNPVMGSSTLTMTGLLDSGCTSSAVNQNFVERH